MREQGCSISEAAKKSGVESYVLRYWEEEGILHVQRNHKGHRCYTEAEFAEIHEIQRLKEEGLSLKEIREVQQQKERKKSQEISSVQTQNLSVAGEVLKAEMLQEKCQGTIHGKDEENQKKQQFYQILERVVREVALTRNREARYHRLDEAIRRQQNTRRMIAATEEKENEKRKKHMKKRPE